MEYAALYIRVSTDEQTELSPAAQERALKEWAARNGYKILPEHIYIDEGISGKKAIKRPAFMTMIGTAKRKPSPFQAILVHKFDRFARSREDSVVYKSLLRKECGVKVISITEQIEDDKFSVILEAMLEAMAEYYSLNLADEVKKGMTEKARRGGYQTHAPFGYEYREAKKPICIKEDEAAAVKMIFEMYVNDHVPTYLIAKKLNEMGLKTKTAGNLKNVQFCTSSTILYMLGLSAGALMVRLIMAPFGPHERLTPSSAPRGNMNQLFRKNYFRRLRLGSNWTPQRLRTSEVSRLTSTGTGSPASYFAILVVQV